MPRCDGTENLSAAERRWGDAGVGVGHYTVQVSALTGDHRRLFYFGFRCRETFCKAIQRFFALAGLVASP